MEHEMEQWVRDAQEYLVGKRTGQLPVYVGSGKVQFFAAT